jgi:hypothetical protein
MSMKRGKEVSRGKDRDLETEGFWVKKDDGRTYKWEDDVATKGDDAFVPYAPTQKFAKDALVVHAKFGKGIVTAVDGGKIDVLFQDGTKKLTHGLS